MGHMQRLMATAALATAASFGTAASAQEATGDAEAMPEVDSAPFEAGVEAIMEDPKFEEAVALMDRGYDRQIEELVELTEIPSGPFMEEAISKRFGEMMTESGLEDVTVDPEGNVLGLWKGTESDGEVLVVSAHMDTVFPEGTDVTVTWDGTKAYAPGIRDDKSSLAIMLAYIRAMKETGIEVRDDVLFVGTVGEEGPGDLRGVRYLFEEGDYAGKIKGFFSVEAGGAGQATRGATGSIRYRAHYTGPGGHSYGAVGPVNPAYALADMMTMLASTKVPADPKTTHNVGIITGGTSVNSIPFEVTADVDMRSTDPAALESLHQRFRVIAEQAAANENARNSTEDGEIALELEQIGLRPAGETAMDTDLYQFTQAANIAAGMEWEGDRFSSTDSNIPMSMGIPALTIGANSGEGGRSHSLDEWLETDKDLTIPNMRATFLVVLSAAGMVTDPSN